MRLARFSVGVMLQACWSDNIAARWRATERQCVQRWFKGARNRAVRPVLGIRERERWRALMRRRYALRGARARQSGA